MSDEGLDLDFVEEALDEFGAHLCQGNLFYGHQHMSGVMLRAIHVTEAPLAEYLAQFELLEER
jgi:hypothetical protein